MMEGINEEKAIFDSENVVGRMDDGYFEEEGEDQFEDDLDDPMNRINVRRRKYR